MSHPDFSTVARRDQLELRTVKLDVWGFTSKCKVTFLTPKKEEKWVIYIVNSSPWLRDGDIRSWCVCVCNTFDERNPAPVDRWFIPLFKRIHTSQVVAWDFWSINSMGFIWLRFSGWKTINRQYPFVLKGQSCSVTWELPTSSWNRNQFHSHQKGGCRQETGNTFPNETQVAKWVFPKIGIPQNGRFIWKTLLKWMIWGYPYF